jgi:hypothetical protein
MGVWGTAIFSDDIAADVRDEYKDLIDALVMMFYASIPFKKQLTARCSLDATLSLSSLVEFETTNAR